MHPLPLSNKSTFNMFIFLLQEQRIPRRYCEKTKLKWTIFTKLYINIAARNGNIEQTDLQDEKYP